jgi:phosphoglucomutase
MALCEAAAYYMDKGMTMWDAMIDLYERMGYYLDGIQTISLPGVEGGDKIQKILSDLRANPPKTIGGYKVISVRDYQLDTITNLATGKVTPTGLPNSNVLYYDMEDGVWLCCRPSGTEPKVKFYYGVKGKNLKDAQKRSDKMGEDVVAMIEKMMK